MIRVRPERFPLETFRKLQARGMGPFEVLSKVGENGYVIDILMIGAYTLLLTLKT